jgi:ADP-ribose pyrophosphatase YjhB (NUDIX family)
VHYLQKSILDKLRYNQPLTYTALMPDGIESSHFRYHLKQLVTDGLVEKTADGLYMLSDKGQHEIDYLSADRTTLIRTPKVITYTLLTYNQQLLLYKKPKEPYRGLWGLIGGKVHFGEDIARAAQREVYEKAALRVEIPMLCGVADITIYKKQKPLSNVIAYVYSLALDELPENLPAEFKLCNNTDFAAGELMPDLQPLLDRIHAGPRPFVATIHCNLE